MIKDLSSVIASPVSWIQSVPAQMDQALLSPMLHRNDAATRLDADRQRPLMKLWCDVVSRIKTGLLAPGLLTLSASLGCAGQNETPGLSGAIFPWLCTAGGFALAAGAGGLTGAVMMRLFLNALHSQEQNTASEVAKEIVAVVSDEEPSLDDLSYTLRYGQGDTPLHLIHPPEGHRLEVTHFDKNEGAVFYQIERENFRVRDKLLAVRLPKRDQLIDCEDCGALAFDPDTGELKGFAIADGVGSSIAGKGAADILVRSTINVIDSLFYTPIDQSVMQQLFLDSQDILQRSLDKDQLIADLKLNRKLNPSRLEAIDEGEDWVASSTLQAGYIHDGRLYHALYGDGGIILISAEGEVIISGRDQESVPPQITTGPSQAAPDQLLYEEIPLNEGDTVLAFTDGMIKGRSCNLDILAAKAVELLKREYSLKMVVDQLIEFTHYQDDCFILAFQKGETKDRDHSEVSAADFDCQIKVAPGPWQLSHEVSADSLRQYLSMLGEGKLKSAQSFLENITVEECSNELALEELKLIRNNVNEKTPLAVLFAMMEFLKIYQNPHLVPGSPLYFQGAVRDGIEAEIFEEQQRIKLLVARRLLKIKRISGSVTKIRGYDNPNFGTMIFYFEKLFENLTFPSDQKEAKLKFPHIKPRIKMMLEILAYYMKQWESGEDQFLSWERAQKQS